MTNDELPRAAAFINRADLLELEDHEMHAVLDDLLDVPPAMHERMLALHEFAQDLFQSDDDYDDFRREVCGLLAGDDACDACGLDPDDCECDYDEDLEPDPIDLADEAAGRFEPEF